MKTALASLPFLLAISGPAQALCYYKGVDNARVTIAQEFHDSRYVALVQVKSGVSAWADYPTPTFTARWGEQGNVGLYRLRVQYVWKGHPAQMLRFFSDRDSGGFYFDRNWDQLTRAEQKALRYTGSRYVGRNVATDVGGRYLVFLNPIPPHAGEGSAERGAVFVNYNCGQSKPWQDVTGSDRALLDRLAKRRAPHRFLRHASEQ